jgi:bifunctional enzyme CysN/CysC
LFSPSGKTARVATIEAWNTPAPATTARAGQSIGITLDEQVFIERGQIASHIETAPIGAERFRARLFWLGRAPLTAGRRYKMKLATAEHWVTVEAIERVIDVNDLASQETEWVERNAVAEVVLKARSQVAFDEFAEDAHTGRFVLVDNFDIVGGGVISMAGLPEQRCRPDASGRDLTLVAHHISADDRRRANGHASGILWLTGLSGSGKSTIAMALERQLFAKGRQVFVLDGDNIRQGLCADLGFSSEDRAENIRRVGEVAHLFAQAGMIVIAAFISPYRADRDRVRAMAPDLFHEIHVKAPLEECQRRDPKGLYAKARQGAIAAFTGVSAPYEAPISPELEIDTARLSVEQAVDRLLAYVDGDFTGRKSAPPRPDVSL